MNLRLYIRNILKEAVATPHFKERVYDRLQSTFTNFNNEKPEIQSKIKSMIEFVNKVNFPGQDNVGILLMKGPNKYVYHQEVNGKTEHSEGSFVWVVIRANDMETIVFGDSTYRPKNTQIHLNIDRLKDYIEKDKNGDFNLTDKDLKKLTSAPPKQVSTQEKNVLPTVNVNGTQWVVDAKQERVYKKNNPSVEMGLLSFMDTVDVQTQDKIMSLI
jgi:hypothetical protein